MPEADDGERAELDEGVELLARCDDGVPGGGRHLPGSVVCGHVPLAFGDPWAVSALPEESKRYPSSLFPRMSQVVLFASYL
ncbi:hypothetical protein GCM10009574_077830 [Streptomyces asiaticus]|uniref:Uncharacterized protein n=2 Tax=Streptomyces rhizosphaericus TaxID=114699 RepID=A0ABN1PJR9_9ACTN